MPDLLSFPQFHQTDLAVFFLFFQHNFHHILDILHNMQDHAYVQLWFCILFETFLLTRFVCK